MKELKTLNKYFVKYKWRFLAGIISVVIASIFQIYPAKYVREATNLVAIALKNVSKDSSHEALYNTLFKFSFFIIGFSLLRGLFMYFMRQTLVVMSRHIEYDLKNEIYQKYQTLDMEFYRQNQTGDLMNRISDDVGRVRMYIGPAVMYTVNLIVTCSITIYVMFQTNAMLTWYTLIPLPILSITIFYVNNLIEKRSDAIQSKLSDLTSFVQQSFSGIRVIKSFGIEKLFEADLLKQSDEYKAKQLSLAKVDALFFPTLFFLTGLSSLIVIFAGGLMVANGQEDIGIIPEFVMYVTMLTWPVTSLGWVSSLVQRAVASQTRINEFLNTEATIKNTNFEAFEFNESIEFKNVSFTYVGKNYPALANVSFKIDKGKTLAILGNTGSGKSTITQLILRMLDAQNGEILVDGKNITTINLHAFREQIGYVPQDVFLFSDSIRNNIAFGVKNAKELSLQSIENASTKASLTENIRMMPKQFDTIIGERGVTLSGGQKQRTAIARAFIKNPPILIFDDSLSALDTKTESTILENIYNEKQNKTIVIISQRVSSAKNADNILFFENGKLVEQGNHQELLNLNSKYADLYNNQLNYESSNTD
ncbi:MAG: ABC transporter ATP-binding protein/permease [Bacteroidia bacterium]|nr:ABC transporter ATP-binding protein/permease [Bacteroidia bacterium]